MPGGDLETACLFAEAMAELEPFEPRPLLAVAVSGGADSLALALLADRWARKRDGTILALVVDHGLRPESPAEADLTIRRLATRGIAARLLRLSGLQPGPAVAARARAARYQVLTEACAAIGCLHLLLGHHRADQAETVMIRALGGSRSAGLAAMPALLERPTVRLLRPLLEITARALRHFLRTEALDWVEDPSNRDRHALRARLRADSLPRDAELAVAATYAGHARARTDADVAAELAERATVRPEGFALLSPGRIRPEALAALLQTVAGAAFPPSSTAVEALAAAPTPTTLAGVRLLPAGRFGTGWMLVREAAAMQSPISAIAGAVWDGRFRLTGTAPAGAMLGALGKDAHRFRSRTGLPTAVLRTLGCLRYGNVLVAVPHLRYLDCSTSARVTLCFRPPRPMAGAPFRPLHPG